MFAGLFEFRRAEKAEFRHAPITVQNGPFLARTQNTKIGPRDKPLQEELTLVDAFLRLKRWAILDCPCGTAACAVGRRISEMHFRPSGRDTTLLRVPRSWQIGALAGKMRPLHSDERLRRILRGGARAVGDGLYDAARDD